MIKLLGAALVVGSTAAFGFGQANRIGRQRCQLRTLMGKLQDMKGEIAYRMTPLPELLCQLGREGTGPVDGFFRTFGRLLLGERPISVPAAAGKALRSTKGLALPEDAVQELLGLSLSLGRYDLDGQLSALARCLTRMERLLEELEAGRAARCRSYCTLGLCAGLALAVMLF